MVKIDSLIAFARTQLRPLLEMSGEVLYSSAETLRPGSVYVLGLNPGGSPPNHRDRTVGAALAGLRTKQTNNYRESWNGRPPGTHPLQRRVVGLLEALGHQPDAVAASNLIFVRSQSAAACGYPHLAEQCWPVHEQILKIVRPRLVLVFGNSSISPYAFLASTFKAQDDEQHPSGHGAWRCRSFMVPGRFRVVGLPHLSRYAITSHPHVVRWIKRFEQ